MVKNRSVKQLLSWPAIESGLQEQSRDFLAHYEILEQVDSTNRWALDACGNPRELPALCLAEQQLVGRGRNGRKWISPYGNNIYLSLVSVFQCPIAKLTG
ncbi:MAG: bifunctional biotin--[acetyl-CoA-carboxylase] synthetase/biotin operon repressor, partial [Gammaproteobacteria bacterium]|nr:bifunctional biotin--[acetyl-CoA-carboxylase] synthetase/biotin operon repressor [Gammaproteobacteria bacterium]